MTLPSFPNIDLFSAGINALNGVCVRPETHQHNRSYTYQQAAHSGRFLRRVHRRWRRRDVLLDEIPSPLKDPMYLLVCILMGLLGLAIYRPLPRVEGGAIPRTLAFFKSFTLPWFAILGAHKALG